ncbi:carboxypeptidase regulatory-like domain-containing protein, partial [Candidatus Ozemobacteraceae bacterium]|nr:carboxypeptidase regulatory-like domain-containing protein [Candidatus Ozemobacteraceae bacterium]
MRKSFVTLLSLALFLGVLLTVGCGGGGGGGSSPVAPIADGSLADLNGRVTYNGNAVPKATVYLMKTTADETELSRRASILGASEPDFSVLTADGNGYQTTSDANGYYSFTQVPVGTYTVQALISPSIQVSQPVILGAISSLDLALKPTGSISGKITLNGSPIQGIVYLDGTSYMSMAGLDGSFKILNVPVEATPYTLVPAVLSSYYPASVRTPSSAPNADQLSNSAQPNPSPIQASVRGSYGGGSYTFKNAPVQVTPVAGTNTDLGTLELVAAMGTLTGVAQIQGATEHGEIYVWTDGDSAYTEPDGSYT